MFLRCFGCMNEIAEHTDVCPVCGYNKNFSENPKECLEPGYLLGGRFVIGKALGIGSFSVSYIAWDCVDEIPVTVKEFLPSDLACHHSGTSELRFFSDEDKDAFYSGLSKFRSLTEKLAELSHLECVHKIIAFIDENETGYAVMEYLTGHTLKHYLAQYRTLSFCDVLDIMTPVIRTVSALHDENIYHLSISPDNIFLCDDGRVMLLNFASSRFEMFSDISRRTIFLHHGFAPIEMYSDDLEPDDSSDVYSLCAVMYKMITGAVPPEPYARRDGTKILSPEELGFTIPEKAQNSLMKGLAIYQKNRISSADELLNTLCSDFKTNKKKTNIFSKISPKIIAAAASGIAIVIIGIILAVFLSNRPGSPVVIDNTTVSATQENLDFSSAFKLTSCTAEIDNILPLRTINGEDVLSDVFIYEKNNRLGLIKTDETIVEKPTHSTIVFDADKNAVLLDGKTYISLNGTAARINEQAEEDSLPVFSDKYLWDEENFSTSRVCGESSYPQFVSEGSFIVSDKAGKYGLITRGNMMVDTIYDEALALSCGVGAFRKGDEWQYLNIYGQDIFERKFSPSDFPEEKPYSFSHGCVPLRDEASGLYGYADFNGETIVDPQFTKALPIVNEKSFVKNDDGWNIIELSSDENPACGNDATYSINLANGLLEITGSGEIWDFTKTNAPWYTYRNVIRTVRITGQITYIGSYSFYGFDSLTSVTLPGSLITIGTSAFDSCKKLRSLSLPSSLTLICDEAFANCTSLSSIVCPLSLNYIGVSAFKNCTDLKKVSLSDNIYTVCDYAFFGCTSMTELSVTSKTADIGNYVFAHCTSLKDVTLPTKASSIGKGAFLDCTSLTTITIPIGITAINDETFKNCTSLKEVIFCDGISLIGNEAFCDCSSLLHATLPQSVRTVGDRAFSGCSSLVSASVPSAKTIGTYAFSGCTSITSFEIPETLRNLGAYAFNGWTQRQTIYGKNMLLKMTVAKPLGWDNAWNANCNANISAR